MGNIKLTKEQIAYAKSIVEQDPRQFMSDEDIGLWDQLARKSKGIGPDYDYSLMGLVDSRGHSGDAGKLPNHPTFSNESAYSGLANELVGGSWKGSTFTPADWQQQDLSAKARQWMVDNNHTDGDIYLDASGKPLTRKVK